MRCYEFQYPDNYLFKEYLTHDARPTGSTSLGTENTGCGIMTSVEEIARYPREWYDPAKMSFEEFAIDRAKVWCSADGPNSSRYATDVVRKEVFTNPHDRKGVEFYLLEVHETHFEDDEEVKIEKRIKGPFYAVSISQTDEPYRALIFEFNVEGEDLFQEKKILKKIINTVRILR